MSDKKNTTTTEEPRPAKASMTLKECKERGLDPFVYGLKKGD